LEQAAGSDPAKLVALTDMTRPNEFVNAAYEVRPYEKARHLLVRSCDTKVPSVWRIVHLVQDLTAKRPGVWHPNGTPLIAVQTIVCRQRQSVRVFRELCIGGIACATSF
jgi:hypothetical protein